MEDTTYEHITDAVPAPAQAVSHYPDTAEVRQHSRTASANGHEYNS